MEDYQPAFVIPEVTDPRVGVTVMGIAERIHPGDRVRAHVQVRGFARRLYLHPVALYVGDRKGAYLFDDVAILTAAILGRLCDHEIGDADTLRFASLTLNSHFVEDWPAGLPRLRLDPSRRARNVGEWTIDSFVTGVPGWAFELAHFRDPETGRTVTRSRVRNAFVRNPDNSQIGTNFPGVGGWEREAMTVLDLDDIMSRVFGVARAAGTATH